MTSRGSIALPRLFAAVTLAWLVTPVPAVAQNAYITGSAGTDVIDTTTNSVSATITVGGFGVAVTSDGSKVYVTNGSGLSVINTATNSVSATITVGNAPEGVAVTQDGSTVYVANLADGTVSVINTATNSVSATITGFSAPMGVAITPDGSKVYVTNSGGGGVSVIATASNTVIATMPTGSLPRGVAVSPDGKKVYVGFFRELNPDQPPADQIFLAYLGIYDTATNTAVQNIFLGGNFAGPGNDPANMPFGVAVTPDGSKVYVTSVSLTSCCVFAVDATTGGVATIFIPGLLAGVSVTPDGKKVYVAQLADGAVSVIDTATNNVTTIPNVGDSPSAFGIFIQPRFAGTAGSPKCQGTTFAVLTRQHGGLTAAATALGFTSVAALQNAITAFCKV